MPKNFLTIVLLIAATGSASASVSDSLRTKRIRHYLGFSLGLTNTKLSGGEIDLMLSNSSGYVRADQKSDPGADLGFIYKIDLFDYFYLRTGAHYISKHSHIENTNFKYPVDANMNFLSVPFVVGIQPINLKNSRHLNVGVESGMALQFDAGSSIGNEDGTHPDNVVKKESMVPAFILGMNVEVKSGNRCVIFFNYRMYKDLGDYYKRHYTWTNSNNEVRTRDYNISIESNHVTFGLLFFLEKQQKFPF